MKSMKVFAFAMSVAAIVCLTACDSDNGGGSGGSGGGGNNGAIPSGFGAKNMTVTVNDGSTPFTTSGSYTLTTTGAANDTSGNYTITGAGGVGNSSGTYTYQT